MEKFSRLFLLLIIFLGTNLQGFAADSAKILIRDLNRIFSDPKFTAAHWGIEVYSLSRAETLYQKNSLKLYIPASNNKILTTAAALTKLGPDYRFETHIFADGPIDSGILKGNLIIRGSGDPSVSARFQSGNPFDIFSAWAAKLKERNIFFIDGDIIGDAGAFDDLLLGQGWEWDDLVQAYAAPVSALQFNDNSIALEITPGVRKGQPVFIQTSPLVDYLVIENRLATEEAGTSPRIRINFGKSIESITVSGSVPSNGQVQVCPVAVQSPVLYFLSALKYALSEQGIRTEKSGIKEKRDFQSPNLSLLWTHASPELSEILKPLMKTSQNLYAETMTRTLGMVAKGEGSFSKGKDVVEDSLSLMGVEKGSYSYADASGLSRQNLISANALVRILRYMFRHPSFSHFYNALPIAGIDGTLEKRLNGTKAENNLRAKTGTLGKVSAISGYIKAANGEMLAFSMLANNFLTSKDAAEQLQDRAIVRLAKFNRK
jgi:D-alanyl-D-alanine carboxypeptidase/D-alanyl-D-alanine-endopeptidase (penicillin-binding protein 4)